MSSVRWTILPILLTVLLQVNCQNTAYPVIPKHLLQCYRDDGIYHRANRMPNTFDYFLDLLRKVESGPTSRNLNARELAMVLLHYVKLDGIQSIRSDSKYYPSHVIPFAPFGSQYFKHRLTVVGLIPKIDPSYQAAFNETLTKKEMCNLHFMLSYSIDPYKRPDERCSPLHVDTRTRTNTERQMPWDPYQNNYNNYYRRYRRHVNRGEHYNGLGATHGEVFLSHKHRATGMKESEDIVKKHTLRRRNSENEKKSEVEEIHVGDHPNTERKAVREEKDKFIIGDQELLSGGELRPRHGMQSLVQDRNFGGSGGRGYPKPMHATDGSNYGGVIPGLPLSECPVVNGVITTPFGSLTIGTVIAGIAAGLNPEDIPPQKLGVEPEEMESPNDRVKNIWGTTLAGNVADTISSSLLDSNQFQILKGGWNDSSEPRWYLLNNDQFRHLPEVTLRGSLDGLLLGLNAKEWTSKHPGFKLSQMLQIYYRRSLGNVGAKNRVQLRPQYAPDELFRKQVHLMSLVMKKQKTDFLTVLDYNQLSRDAVASVIQHIQTMDENKKSYIGSFVSTQVDNTINMIAVIDSSWSYESLRKIFEELRTAQAINIAGSNLTIVCGKDGRILLSSSNSVDMYMQFTREGLIENCTRGMDYPLIFDTLDTMYRKIYYNEKMSEKMNTDSQVVVLFPYESLPQEFSYIKEKSMNFRGSFPDVRLIIASNGRSESFGELVESPKDVFPLVSYSSELGSNLYKEFSEGVKQSYQRLSRPSCGSYFDDDSVGTDVRVTRDIGIGDIVYYRLLPQYFFTQHGQATVSIRSKQRAPLTVCHSRKMERPTGPTPRGDPGAEYNPNRTPEYNPDFLPEALYGRQTNEESEGEVECKTITGETYKIEMNNPCEGVSRVKECNPLYISLTPPHQESINHACQVCRLPFDIEYEITVSGLTCYNSATVKLLSPILFSLLFIYYSLKHFY